MEKTDRKLAIARVGINDSDDEFVAKIINALCL